MRIKVIVTSDFLCPWCYLGEVRLFKAVAALGLQDIIDLEWKPYELNPDMPSSGMDRQLYRSRKFGTRIADQKDTELTDLGRQEGVLFNFAAIDRACNTRLAHRLQRFAASQDMGSEFCRRVFRAYFEEGMDIGQRSVLLSLVEQLGMVSDEAREFLERGGGDAEVVAEEAQAARLRIHAVPHFRIGEKVVNGAQSVEAFKEVLLAALNDQQTV